jgi:hypothetical protein
LVQPSSENDTVVVFPLGFLAEFPYVEKFDTPIFQRVTSGKMRGFPDSDRAGTVVEIATVVGGRRPPW